MLEKSGFIARDEADLVVLYHEILATKVATWNFGLVPLAAAVRELIDLRAEARRRWA